MRCPVCKSVALTEECLKLGLKAYHCQQCQGSWIRFRDYDAWNHLEDHTADNPVSVGELNPEFDTKRLSFCPECGVALIKYKVAPRLPFTVDHCGNCNGVWLDAHEWENLVSHHLHDKMNCFFTPAWQKKLREELTRERFVAHYIAKFGQSDYEKLKAFREWLQNYEKGAEAIAYLIDEDPYSI
jgi:Zn-finger nucleic acid-binding protein